MERKNFLIACRSAVLPHYLYQWDVWHMWPEPRWLTDKKLAKRFAPSDARKIVDYINGNLTPGIGALCGAYIERIP